MTKFQIRILRLPPDEEQQVERLNAEGANGWSVVGILPAGNDDVLVYVQRENKGLYRGDRDG